MIGVLTGLESEVRLVRDAASTLTPVPLVACSGANAERAASCAFDLVEGGATLLVSFGLAGGLSPRLRPGVLVIADHVVTLSGLAVATDATLRRRLLEAADRSGLSAEAGAVLGVDRVAGTVAQKRVLAAGGAIAVDMESHVLAEVATARGLPLIAIRAIADPADAELSPLLADVVGEDGKAKLGRILLRLAGRPGELAALWRTRGFARAATGSLRALLCGGALPLMAEVADSG